MMRRMGVIRASAGVLVALGSLAALLPLSALAAPGDPVGTEFQVNSYTTGSQSYPSVGVAANGSFVVAWQSPDQDGDSMGVFGQRFASDGSKAGTEFQVNSYTTGAQGYVSAGAAANGSFVVTWQSNKQDGSVSGVFGQRFASNGSKAGTEFQANSYTTDGQYSPSVGVGAGGTFVVAWYSRNQDGSDFGVFGQRFASNGSKAGTEFQVNSYTTDRQSAPSVGVADNGSFVIAWESDQNQDGSGFGVFGQRFASNGSTVGTEFQVNSYTTDAQSYPNVGVAGNGSFVIAWQSNNQDGDGFGVFGQRFASDGSTVGTEFQVSSYTTYDQQTPRARVAADGSFVVVWQSYNQDGDSLGVFGQRFASDGSTVGTEFLVNTFTTSDQNYPSVGAAANGGFVVAWQSNFSEDGNRFGVFGQRFAGASTAAPAPAPVLSHFGLIGLLVLLSGVGCWLAQRRRVRQ